MKHVFQLKVEINDIKPKIWRRLLVSSDTTFYQLHHILQIALGWKNYHLFQFELDKKFIGLPDPDFKEMSINNATDIPLKKVLSLHKKFAYEYDLGDFWCHSIILEDILPVNPEINYPCCMEGERNAPPKDSGGTQGYDNVLKTLKNKKHPRRKELIEWLGGEDAYDREYMDLKEINKQLMKLEVHS